MQALEFIESLRFFDVLVLALLQAAAFFILYSLVKNRQPGFVDPFTLTLFFSASAWSTVIYLFATDRCSARLFFSFVLTNASFFWGYLSVAPRLIRGEMGGGGCRSEANQRKFFYFGAVVCTLYFVFVGFNYALFGFGIEHEARLEIYTNSQGLGILKRGMDALMPAAVFTLLFFALRLVGLPRVLSYAALAVILLNTALDGSKSGVVQFGLACVVCVAWYRRWGYIELRKRRSIAITLAFSVAAVSVAAFVLAIQMNAFENPDSVLVVGSILLFRLLVAGDIFILGYPGELIDKMVPAYNAFVVLFNDPISVFRIAKLEVIPLGNQLYNYFLIDRFVESGGPNSHLAIYSYYLFGEFGSLFMCAAFGLAFGFIRKGVVLGRGGRPVAGALYVTLLANEAAILIDPSYSIIRLTNIVVFLLPIALIFTFTLKVSHESRGSHS